PPSSICRPDFLKISEHPRELELNIYYPQYGFAIEAKSASQIIYDIHPSIIFGTIFVLHSLPYCGKNIITSFIRKSLFGLKLVYLTSDLGKILGKFNTIIQECKLIIMNE
ncbi:15246_t:CDS:2, partial [Funneliformis geosporum]